MRMYLRYIIITRLEDGSPHLSKSYIIYTSFGAFSLFTGNKLKFH